MVVFSLQASYSYALLCSIKAAYVVAIGIAGNNQGGMTLSVLNSRMRVCRVEELVIMQGLEAPCQLIGNAKNSFLKKS